MLKQFLAYNAVGIVNTLFGFGIIFILMYAGVDPVLSNAIGYGIGAILSYVINRKYTFREHHSVSRMLKFFVVLGIAYLLNVMTLQWVLPLLNPYIAQIVSAVVYTLSSFLLMKVFVFKELNSQ